MVEAHLAFLNRHPHLPVLNILHIIYCFRALPTNYGLVAPGVIDSEVNT